MVGKIRRNDLIFGVQLAFASISGVAQLVRSFENVEGTSVVLFILGGFFFAFNYLLAWEAYGKHLENLGAWKAEDGDAQLLKRHEAIRDTIQVLIMYGLWVVVSIAVILAIWFNPAYRWNGLDTLMVEMVAAGTLAVIAIWKLQKVEFTDPMVKGLLAMTYKAIPQLIQAAKVWNEGGDGISGVSVFFGQSNVLIRLYRVLVMCMDSGWDRPSRWLLWSELSNELTGLPLITIWAWKVHLLDWYVQLFQTYL